MNFTVTRAVWPFFIADAGKLKAGGRLAYNKFKRIVCC